MSPDLESVEPGTGRERRLRKRLGLKEEFLLAFLPTVTVLGVLWFVGVFSEQKIPGARDQPGPDPDHGPGVRRAAQTNLVLFLMALAMVAVLVILERHAL